MRVVDVRAHAVYRFGEVVRRDVGRKADGYAARAVDEQIGKAPGQHVRFFERVVEVAAPAHGVLVQIAQQLERERREPGLGVSHRRGAVAVYRAEVALTVHERRVHVEGLRQSDERAVHRAVAVRVELAQAVAHYARALAVGCVGTNAQLAHREEYAALDGLESVLHARERAVKDDVFGIGQHGFGHDVLHALYEYPALRGDVVFCCICHVVLSALSL